VELVHDDQPVRRTVHFVLIGWRESVCFSLRGEDVFLPAQKYDGEFLAISASWRPYSG
jgi:hypothetical protein